MRLTLTAPDTGRKWKLEPLDNGLCYQLFVEPMKGAKNPRTGKAIKAEWTFTGSYATSIDHGVSLIIKKMLADPNGKAEIDCDPKYLTKNFKKVMDDYVQKIIESITIDMCDFETEALQTVLDAVADDSEEEGE